MKKSNAFEQIMEGLNEVQDFLAGQGPATVTEVMIKEPKGRTGKQIKKVREKLGYSQAVFAGALSVSKKTVEAWEAGRNAPSGVALRLIDLIDQDADLLHRNGVIIKTNKKAS